MKAAIVVQGSFGFGTNPPNTPRGITTDYLRSRLNRPSVSGVRIHPIPLGVLRRRNGIVEHYHHVGLVRIHPIPLGVIPLVGCHGGQPQQATTIRGTGRWGTPPCVPIPRPTACIRRQPRGAAPTGYDHTGHGPLGRAPVRAHHPQPQFDAPPAPCYYFSDIVQTANRKSRHQRADREEGPQAASPSQQTLPNVACELRG